MKRLLPLFLVFFICFITFLIFQSKETVKPQLNVENTPSENKFCGSLKDITDASIAIEKNNYEEGLKILSNCSFQDDLYENRKKMLLSIIYLRQSKYPEALEEIGKIDKTYFPEYSELLTAEVLINIDENKALDKLREISGKYPTNPPSSKAFFYMGNIYFNNGNYGEAIKYYKKAISTKKRFNFFPDVYYKLGKSFENEENLSEALKYYSKLIYFYPFSPLALDGKKRISHIEKTKKIPCYIPTVEEISNIAEEYDKHFQFKKALGYYKIYTDLYPKEALYSGGLYDRAICECSAGTITKAKELLNTIVKYNGKKKPEAMYKLAELSGSIEELKHVASSYPGTSIGSKAQYKAAYYLAYDGKTSEAIKEYRLMAKKFPKGSWGDMAFWDLGRIYYKQKLYSNAYDAFMKAVTIYPDNEWAVNCLYWQGKCAEKLNKTKDAVIIYKKIVDRYDHTYYSYRARAKLVSMGYGEYFDIKHPGLSFPEGLRLPFKGTFDDEHYKKFSELCELGLFEEAENEYTLIDFPPDKEREKIFASGLIMVGQGKYFDAIECVNHEFDRVIAEGKLDELPLPAIYVNFPLCYMEYISREADIRQIDSYLVSGLIREESHCKPDISSWVGAMGLMQIMPETGNCIAKELDMKFNISQLTDPEINIAMGTYYISKVQKDLYDNEILSLAGYNGGPGNSYEWWETLYKGDIDEFVENIPYWETRNYVKRVLRSYWEYKRLYDKENHHYFIDM